MSATPQPILREIAERIITRDYKAIAVVTLNDDATPSYYSDGGLITALGLVEAMADDLRKKINYDDE